MNRKLADWASIAEIVSGLAVVVTLVVLIAEIRDNTQVMRVSAYADSVDSINEFGALVSRDADSARIWDAYVTGNTDDRDRIDLRRLQSWAYIQFRNYEKAYFSEQSGLLGGEEWERFDRTICDFFARAQSAGLNIEEPLTLEFLGYVTNSCND